MHDEKMELIETAAACQRRRRAWRTDGQTVGFVPTMGALHEGHVSLIERAGRECQRVVVSLFVNPTQFNQPEDLQNYPQPRAQDLALLERHQVAAVFLPEAGEIYQDHHRFEIREKELSQVLCGLSRPGHFEGVLTVVLKLLGIVQPERVYFGEKDFQQLRLIQEMVRAFFLETIVVPCPTVREADGLAMSSRNARLSAAERCLAPNLYRILTTAPTAAAAAAQLTALGFGVDYVEERWGRRFAAVQLGSVRLIDNVPRSGDSSAHVPEAA